MTQDEAKRLVAKRAVEFVQDGMAVGLGTGTTATMFIRELGARVQQLKRPRRGLHRFARHRRCRHWGSRCRSSRPGLSHLVPTVPVGMPSPPLRGSSVTLRIDCLGKRRRIIPFTKHLESALRECSRSPVRASGGHGTTEAGIRTRRIVSSDHLRG